MARVDLSVIIPAYQEARRIEKTLDALADYLNSHDLGAVEVLVVVADSPDGTARLAAGKSGQFKDFRVVAAGPKVGKGHQVRIGIMEATGRYKLFMDADLATPLEHLRDVKKFMDRRGDVAIGTRNLHSSHQGIRQFVSEFGNLLVRLLLLPGISDSQCGFKVFSAEAASEIFHRQTIVGWGFDMEILAIARKLGCRIETIMIPDWQDMPHGTVHGGILAAALQTFGDLILITWRRLVGRYKSRTFVYEPYRPA